MKCQRCGAESEGKFCNECGTQLQPGSRSTLTAETTAGENFKSGCGTAALLIPVGVFLCLIGLVIIGIPVIIFGVFLPLFSAGSKDISGACPYCGTSISASQIAAGVTCSACRRRIVIKDGRFYSVD